MTEQEIAEQFVREWNKAKSVYELANKLKAKEATLYAKAYRYRKMGIKLKLFPSGRIRLNRERLQQLVNESTLNP